MTLFAAIPERLFSLLASRDRIVYAHVLFLIYDLHKQELYGTPREAVVDAAVAYLETENLTEEDPYPVDPVGLSPRDKAGTVLRRRDAGGADQGEVGAPGQDSHQAPGQG